MVMLLLNSPLADPRRSARDARPFSVQFFSCSCSFQEKFSQIKGWHPTFRVGAHPVWKVLDQPLFNIINLKLNVRFLQYLCILTHSRHKDDLPSHHSENQDNEEYDECSHPHEYTDRPPTKVTRTMRSMMSAPTPASTPIVNLQK